MIKPPTKAAAATFQLKYEVRDLEGEDAKLDAESNDLAWRGFEYDWDARPGEHVLTVRAYDESGRVQPIEAPWNRGGFANNSAQRITVLVR